MNDKDPTARTQRRTLQPFSKRRPSIESWGVAIDAGGNNCLKVGLGILPLVLSVMMFLLLQLIVAVALIGASIMVAVGIVRTRKMAVQGKQSVADDLAEFRRMREAGDLEEDEYQRLRKVISSQTVAKAKNTHLDQADKTDGTN